MHRHSCVIAILCERIYCETAQTGKAEKARTLMCHRNPLGRIYCGTEQVGEVENTQTLDVSSQSFRKDLLLNSKDWKSREHTDTHVSPQSFVEAFTVKQHRLGKAENAQTLMCHRSMQKQKQKTSVPLHNSKPDKNTYRKEPVQDTKKRRK